MEIDNYSNFSILMVIEMVKNLLKKLPKTEIVYERSEKEDTELIYGIIDYLVYCGKLNRKTVQCLKNERFKYENLHL